MEATAPTLLEVVPPCSSDETALAALPAAMREWFGRRFGRPTTAQRTAWPVLASGRNLLLSAPTGTGKTLAAFAPLLGQLLTQPPAASVRCLYLTPLKALGNDVRKSLRTHLAGIVPFLADFVPLPRVFLRTGDTPPRARQRLWSDPPEVLLTTPESLAVLLTHEGAGDLFGGLRWVIVDEVHALAAGKRGADLALSLERLAHWVEGDEVRPTGRLLQRIGLSATSTPLDEAARFLTGGRPCVLAQVGESSPLQLTLRPLQGENSFLSQLLDQVLPELPARRSTLIFTNTRGLAERLSWALRRRLPAWDDRIAVHHSSLAPARRRRVERQFKRGQLRVVVSSTSLELGIDIGAVDLVVLVHPPGDVVRLLQRVGRAGHGPGRTRHGLVLTATTAELLEATVTGASGRSCQCEPLRVPSHPLDVLCQHLLGMAAVRAWTADEAFRLVRRAHAYRALPRRDFDDCLAYLSGGGIQEPADGAETWLPPRLRWDGDRFTLLNERTARLLRRNLGTILADEPCAVFSENPKCETRNPKPEKKRLSVSDFGFGISDFMGDSSTPQARLIGHVDEAFAERLQPGDRFLLDGRCLEVCRLERLPPQPQRLVATEVAGRPRVPVWGGDGWPLSAELARRLYVFRNRAAEALRDGPEALAQLLRQEYALEAEAGDALTSFFLRQECLSEVPDPGTCLVEAVRARGGADYYVHTPLNRKANDALARVASARLLRKAPSGGPLLSVVADLGFALWVRGGTDLTPDNVRALLAVEGFEEDLRQALSAGTVLRERFQRVALTGLMLLRNPLGQRRRVGGSRWGERRLFDQVRAAQPDFVLLRQAEREVFDEVCDVAAAREYLEQLPHLAVRCRWLAQPSPLVEGWTQTTTGVAEPAQSPEEVLRSLHATLMGERPR